MIALAKSYGAPDISHPLKTFHDMGTHTTLMFLSTNQGYSNCLKTSASINVNYKRNNIISFLSELEKDPRYEI